MGDYSETRSVLLGRLFHGEAQGCLANRSSYSESELNLVALFSFPLGIPFKLVSISAV